MLVLAHALQAVDVEKVENAVEVLHPRENHVVPRGAPVDLVDSLLLQRLEQSDHGLPLLEHGVKGDIHAGGVPVQQAEAVPLGLPRKRQDVGGDLQHLDGYVLVLHPEHFEAEGGRLLALLPVNLDAKVGAVWVPLHVYVGDVDEVLLLELLAGGHLGDYYTGGVLLEGRHVGREAALRGGPAEVADPRELEGLLVKDLHIVGRVDLDRVLNHPREILVVVAPLEWLLGLLAAVLELEGTLLLPRPDIPHNGRVDILGVPRPVGPRVRHDVGLLGGELDTLDVVVHEPPRGLELFAPP
mmetsp:Transcript_30661/g.77594  ORF Transcript_30661/g.77594 Transcript_30661/m.77594 type:complete len:298 (-) Transcript_30661:267-1160(-)